MKLYKLNEYQNAIMNIERVYSDTSVCCIGGFVTFSVPTDKNIVTEALKAVVRTTPTMRLRLNNDFNMYISDEEPSIEELLFSGNEDIYSIVERFMKEPLQLKNSPLYQIKYIVTSNGEFAIAKIHHILGDYTSFMVFLKEFEKMYFKIKDGIYDKKYIEKSPDYYIETSMNGQKRDYRAARSYYAERFKEYGEKIGTATLHSTEQGIIEYRLGNEDFDAVIEFCKNNKLKIQNVIYSALALYNKKIKGEDKSVFGRAVMNRGRKEMNVFGLYANTLPLFVNADGDFLTVCKNVKREMAAAMTYSSYPLNDILNDNGLTERCFDIAVSFISERLLPDFKFIKPHRCFGGNTELPMRLHVIQENQSVHITAEYAKEIYTQAQAEGFVKSIVNIIICGVSGKALECLTHEDKAEYTRLNSVKCIDADMTVSKMFSQYAKNHSSETAVIFNGEEKTFAEVEAMANIIAEAVGGYKIVGIAAGRCEYLVPAMLGVLKSGGAYMPVPENIKANSECDVILTLSGSSSCGGENVILLDKLNYSSPTYRDFSRLESEAYFMRTSGTSGNPKTVRISNESLYLRLKWMHDEYSLKKRILQKTRIGFDVSGWELLCVIFGGCCVMPKDGEERDFTEIYRYIEKYKIEMIHFVPSMLRLFLKYINKGSCNSLKEVISSGEALDTATVKLFYEKLPNVKLRNLYGPTECTIDVTSYTCNGNESIIPIGKPVYNTQIYILTPTGELAPRGVMGEITVVGDLVGMGYTSGTGGYTEFFGKKAYRTGDIGYLGFDGNIYYCGRSDYQVKISGKRINLSEIEGLILGINGVTDAAVLYDGKRVSAYYSADTPIEDIALRMAELTDRLPAMYIYTKNMPITSSGKKDRKALMNIVPERKLCLPSNETERKILDAVFGELNNGEFKLNIGVEDNFFDAGLDSLAVLSLMLRLEECGFDLSVQDIYANPTVRMLAKRQRKPRPLVRLNSIRSDKAMVCFPYAGGQPQAFEKIAEEAECEVLGINYDFFDKADTEEILRHICECLKDKKEIVPVACCAGTALALAAAKSLEEEGKKIDGVYIMGNLPAVVAYGINPWRILGENSVNKILSKVTALPSNFRYERFIKDTDRYFKYMSKNKPVISSKAYIAFAEKDIFTKGFRKKAKLWNKYFKDKCVISVFKTDNHYFVSDTDSLITKMKRGGEYE